MNKIKNNQQKGFIALFLVLGISFTFLTWISLGSKRVFEYLEIKKQFNINRSEIHNIVSCADAFITLYVESRYNLIFIDNKYLFERNLYFDDDFICKLESVVINYKNNNLDKVLFIIDDFTFEYQFENGFVKFIKSFNIL